MNLGRQIQGFLWILIMILTGLLGTNGWTSESKQSSFDLSPLDLVNQQSDGVVIIDIRRQQEWIETGVLKGAKTITAFQKDGKLHPEFKADFDILVPNLHTPFILYCRSGRRTGILRDALEKSLGFTRAMHLSGGIVAWKKVGKSLVNYTQ